MIIPSCWHLETKDILSPFWVLDLFCLWFQEIPQVIQKPVATSRAESLLSCSLLL